MALLARRAERRALDSMATYFAVTAGDVDSSIVYLPGTGTSGVVWNDGTIVTVPLERHAGETIVQVASGEHRARPAMWGPRLPLAALAIGSGLPGLSAARGATSRPEAGGWVLAVWRAGRGEQGVAPGSYLQSASLTCGPMTVQEIVSSLALNPMMAGGGLFDIDGGLLAVILPCGDRLAAISTTSIEAILRVSDTSEQRLLARYGLVLGALDDAEKAYFKIDDGAIVREVWTGYRGDEVGLMPGDIIGALDGISVATPGDLLALTEPTGEQALELTVRRGPRTLMVALSGNDVGDVSGMEAAPGAGLVWEAPEPYRIDSVVPGSRAAMAGIERGDRLVRIDHAEPRNLAQVQRIFAGTRTLPVLVEIERGDRRLAVLVR